MAVADHRRYPVQAGEFFGGALGVAAGDQDAGFGVEPVGAADEGAGGAVGFGGDAAGIHNDQVGGGGALLIKAGQTQAVADGFAIGARSPASEMFDMIVRHERPSPATPIRLEVVATSPRVLG